MIEGLGIGATLGGIGLFLLGMVLMTDGLKQAAGPALGRVLTTSTQTRLRGLLSGITFTAVVQSSSAVTVAAIGFVNAGLLTFSQSLWVLFGSNVGTTVTGWLVALVGFKLDVDAAAMPMIGLGMALRLTGADTRRAALGTALTGFGVLFLGIGFLQEAFSIDGAALDLSGLGGAYFAVPAYVLAGALLTLVMQSSSASLAVTLTLAHTGSLSVTDAAAMVIGANIGTTATAMLAAIGATANAKRAASAHVLFNVVTGVVAMSILPWMIRGIGLLGDWLDLDNSPATALALFHTVFNVLGVLLMWPLADRMAAMLRRRFRGHDESAGQPRYLDQNVASVPSLAVDALRREIYRLGRKAIVQARSGLARLQGQPPLPRDEGYDALSGAIRAFSANVARASMSETTADALAKLLRVQHYFDDCHERGAGIGAGHAAFAALADGPLRLHILGLAREADDLLVQLDPAQAPFAPLSPQQSERFEATYAELKEALLAAGADGRLPIESMDALLRSFSDLRRTTQQAAKAARLLARPAR
ncbi:Na/Pi symporter [Arenimonas caeni]|jgi:phosphate:Na+ symporter|uniref:Na/Pi cotransporter family protein n=1 Tax=Arenimonas caeni TaxID=2058085 RepID=UPI002A35F656|nr:Na/Pi symporter [Arenimonas caeni]MDY0021733.1 Na/Pi symporter [Arenimonas caeni]